MTREFVHVLNLILFFRIFLSHAGGTTAAATDTIPVFTPVSYTHLTLPTN